MAKNSIFDPTKDGVKADNSGYSSNQIDKMIGESAVAVIDDDAAGDDTVYSSAKIYSLLPEDTATGAEVTITDACPDLPIVELTADINAVQEGTGDPSPDNVRPISGWDKITVTHDDIDVEISLGENTVYGGVYNSDGTLTVTHKLIDMSSVSYTYVTTDTSVAVPYFRTNPSDKSKGSKVISSGYKQASGARSTMGDMEIAPYNLTTSSVVCIANSDYTDPDVFKDAMEGITILYELDTPTTLTVGSLAFNTNGEGSTIISCDSGDVTVKYKKLTTLS